MMRMKDGDVRPPSHPHPLSSFPQISTPLIIIQPTGKAPPRRQERRRRRLPRQFLVQRLRSHGTSGRKQVPRRLRPEDLQRTRSRRQDRHRRCRFHKHRHFDQRDQRSQRRHRRERGGERRWRRRRLGGFPPSRVVPTPRERAFSRGVSRRKHACMITFSNPASHSSLYTIFLFFFFVVGYMHAMDGRNEGCLFLFLFTPYTLHSALDAPSNTGM